MRGLRWAGAAQETPVDATPRYDSVVIRRAGFCGLVAAGRLARSGSLRDAVTVVGPRVEESRRLVGGCTLRARSLEWIAAAMGREREEIESRLLDPGLPPASTHRQHAALLSGEAESGLRIVQRTCFMDASKARRGRRGGTPLAFGVRNSRLLALLEELARENGVRFVEAGGAAADLRAIAGEKALLVNAAPGPIEGLEVAAPPRRPRQFVAAVQVPFRAERLDARGVVEADESFVCWLPDAVGLQMGVFYPFQDPLSPSADFYGIVYRVVDASRAADRAAVFERLSATLLAVGELLGLQAVDRRETRGEAMVPVSPWSRAPASQPGVLELSRLCGAGSPIITGDGMTRSAIGGVVAAESVLLGRDAAADVHAALAGYRRLNRELHLLLSTLSLPARWLLRSAPDLTLWRQSRSYHRDMWAGAA